jgi:hypothetical protein
MCIRRVAAASWSWASTPLLLLLLLPLLLGTPQTTAMQEMARGFPSEPNA